MFGNLEVFHSFHYVSFPNISLETQTVFHISKKISNHDVLYDSSILTSIFLRAQFTWVTPAGSNGTTAHGFSHLASIRFSATFLVKLFEAVTHPHICWIDIVTNWLV